MESMHLFIVCRIYVSFVVCCLLNVRIFGFLQPAQTGRKPPTITKHPPLEKIFKAGETISLPCQSNGTPSPNYNWQKNEKNLSEIEKHVVKQEDGTLTIKDGQESDQGIYQCFALNKYGVAVSIKTELQMAVLDPFPSTQQPMVNRPIVGNPLTLRCNPPYSYPSSSIYWGENRIGSKLRPVETTDRISLDYKGNLHFANVLMDDYRNGVTYACIVVNNELRSLVQGDDQKIDPQKPSVLPIRYEPPRLVFYSPIPDVAVKGQTKKIKCIFSGYPTPNVTWKKLDTAMPNKVRYSSYGQELIIPDMDFEDAGRYQCEGKNMVSSSSKDIILTVESPPYWRSGSTPDDIIASEDDEVVIICQVNGVPKPTIKWSINGIPIEVLPLDLRRSVVSNWIRIVNVIENDTQVIQCNASNSHGYLFTNVFLSVQAEPPSFIVSPQKEVCIPRGQTAVMNCRVYGAPKPTIQWKRGNEMKDITISDSDHFRIQDNGDLQIKEARSDDEDMYWCQITNKFGSDISGGKLLIRERTIILEGPNDQTVDAGNFPVTFSCNATTYFEEMNKLKLEWYKDGKMIPVEDKNDRISVVSGGHQLTVKNPRVSDTGDYSCQASNGLDFDKRSARLTVKDRPSPPVDIRLTRCTTNSAEISWTSGNDNNDKIIRYIVYFNTSHSDLGKYEDGLRVNGSKHSARVQLRPWTNYTFHVISENSLGFSDKSDFTVALCTTHPAKPFRNPRQVCSDSKSPSQLVIVWEPMLRNDHNGPGFHYVITYKKRGRVTEGETGIGSNEEFKQSIFDWRQSELIIEGQETFQEYEVTVQAANNIGTAHGVLDKMIVYSGEDVPLEQPKNFRLIENTLNSSLASFQWEAVDENPARIRGFFKGYQIQFWKLSDPGNVQNEDVIIRDWKPCQPLLGDPGHHHHQSHGIINYRTSKQKRKTKTVEGTTSKLWPFSKITAGVIVVSGTKHGYLSQTINFTTPEGVPAAVPAFWVSERGSHHLRLSWSAPFEINGILNGYFISYKEAPPTIDAWKETFITDPESTYRKIHDLKSDTVYLISICAETGAGCGQTMTIEETTVAEDVPDQPTIVSLESGYNFVNVSWLPSVKEAPRSLGSDFIVEYRRLGSSEWEESMTESEHNYWLNVTDLTHGTMYELRVVAMNRKGDAMKSETNTLVVGIQQDLVTEAAGSYGWLVALICLLLLVVIAVMVAFLFRRNRSGMYPVYKKEKLNGDEKRLDKENAFGEYVRTDGDSLKQRSEASLDSTTSKTDEETTDSLSIYEDGLLTKFNDEGSLIKEETNNKKIPENDEEACQSFSLPTF